MKIDDGLAILELHNNPKDPNAIFRPTLIWDDNTVILVDTGVPGQFQNIYDEMETLGVPFESLNKVIITHHDMDHIGSLSHVIKESKHKVEVISHEGEKPYIQGEIMPIKMTPEKIAKINSLPEDEKKAVKAMYASLSAKVDTLVKDEEELPYCGGIIVIHTPGHTPGHICLYLKKYKTLVTGDALNVFHGELYGPNPIYTFNLEEATSSLKKLLKYDIQTVMCYHGGVFNNNANEKIAELVGNIH
jgi:glyoxylase-like metal-dependent hydrolase (beta-lactamase superfamily II)